MGREVASAPGSFPGKSHGQGVLPGYSPRSHKTVRHDLAAKQQQRFSMCRTYLRGQTGQLIQFSSVAQSRLTVCNPWTAAHQASLSTTNSQSLLKPTSVELVMPSNHLILCHPLRFLPSIPPSIRVFSNESALYIRWPE